MGQQTATLRDMINDAKARCLAKNGCLDWEWEEDALLSTVLRYADHTPLDQFTDDDFRACAENGLSRSDVVDLCTVEDWM